MTMLHSGVSVMKLCSSVSLCLPQEDDMPEEVNIDDLIDLPSHEERVRKLQVSSPMHSSALVGVHWMF